MIARWMGDSAILPVRISILILLALVSLANELGMEIVLGAYTAGMAIAMLVRGTKAELLEDRLTSIGSGFFIPLFFVTSGVEFDLPALVTSPASLARLFLFCAPSYTSAFFRFACTNACSRSAICFRLLFFPRPRCRLSSR